MRALLRSSLLALLAVALGHTALAAQFGDPDRVIPGGGIHVAGWTGKIDNQSAGQGGKLEHSRFAQEGADLHVTTGPATTFWNPANTASGDYTVKATFTEPKYMALNSHPHSYGIVIGGNDLGTADQSLLYCAAYGDGTFIIRGFGPGPFQMNGQMGAKNAAVHRAAGVGQPVTQEIAWTVRGGRAECSINGTVVGGYDRAQLVTSGKLESTDGVYGLRFTHNVEAVVSGFAMTRLGAQAAAPAGGAQQAPPPALALVSPAWADGGAIPFKYTGAAENGKPVSPPLEWTNVPEGTVSFVMIMHDPDAARNKTTEDNLHWIVWNVPGTVRKLPEGVAEGAQLADGTRQMNNTAPTYGPPGARATNPRHHYTFEMYALDTMLDVAAGTPGSEARTRILAAMNGHVIGKAVYVGLFRRPN